MRAIVWICNCLYYMCICIDWPSQYLNLNNVGLKEMNRLVLSPWLSNLNTLSITFYDQKEEAHEDNTREVNKMMLLSLFVRLLTLTTSLEVLKINSVDYETDSEFNYTLYLPKLRVLKRTVRNVPELILPTLTKINIHQIYVIDLLRVLTDISHVDSIYIGDIDNHTCNKSEVESYNTRITLESLTTMKLAPFASFVSPSSTKITKEEEVMGIPSMSTLLSNPIRFMVTKFTCYGLNKQFVPILSQMTILREITLQTCFQSFDVIGNLFRIWSKSLSYVDFRKSILDSGDTKEHSVDYLGYLSFPIKGTIISLPQLTTLKLFGWNQDLIDSMNCPQLGSVKIGQNPNIANDNDDDDNDGDNDNHVITCTKSTDSIDSLVNIERFLKRTTTIKTLHLYQAFRIITIDGIEYPTTARNPAVPLCKMSALTDLLVDVGNVLPCVTTLRSLLLSCPNLSRLSLCITSSTDLLNVLIETEFVTMLRQLKYLSLTHFSVNNDVNENTKSDDDGDGDGDDDYDSINKRYIAFSIIKQCTSLTVVGRLTLNSENSTNRLIQRVLDLPERRLGYLISEDFDNLRKEKEQLKRTIKRNNKLIQESKEMKKSYSKKIDNLEAIFTK
jgi:hypothetical protein